MPLMSRVIETHPVIVTMLMKQSDDNWEEIAAWFKSRKLNVIWSSNMDTNGIHPTPFIRYFCFREEDRRSAMMFKLVWA